MPVKLKDLLKRLTLKEYTADEIYDGDNPYYKSNSKYEGDPSKPKSSSKKDMTNKNNLKSEAEDVSEPGDAASEEAHKLGLTSAGWGNWKDQSGKTVAKTVQGKLVKVDNDSSASPESPEYAESPGSTVYGPDDYNDSEWVNPAYSNEPEADLSLTGNTVDMVAKKAATPGGQLAASSDDYFNAPEQSPKPYSGRQLRDEPKAQALAAKVKEIGGAETALGKISPKHRSEFAKTMKSIATLHDLGSAVDETGLGIKSKLVNALLNLGEDDLSDFDQPTDIGQYEGFALSDETEARIADTAWMATDAIKQGQNPDEAPEFLKAMKNLTYDINLEVDRYNDAVRGEEHNPGRYIRRPYDRF